jgi:glutamine---fructose-6-phosphate transaminase (isomerizing)
MCGIFGIVADEFINKNHLLTLARHAMQRGKDSSGMLFTADGKYQINRADYDILRLLKESTVAKTKTLVGHSRLVTNGLSDNQPVVRENLILIHNGIIVNEQEVWSQIDITRKYEIDSEAIIGTVLSHIDDSDEVGDIASKVLTLCKGTISVALAIPSHGKLLLFSNNGSLYSGDFKNATYFSSERYPLEKIKCQNIQQIWKTAKIIDIPISDEINIHDERSRTCDLIPSFKNSLAEEKSLRFRTHDLRRCTQCVLPESMPFIFFDAHGVCNYCNNYQPRNKPKPKDELMRLVEPYRRAKGADCIIPFSGGRDSSWGLHLVLTELKLKPITYTYDWGMVTDLGRRNISRMCSILGVENIIIADDIERKRQNIALNLKAWLKSPNLGMISILTAGDKHFFRHIETVKKQTGISLNLWGVNPLEVTHFKAGFLGVPPDFEEKRVYMHGFSKQINYQLLRFRSMLKSIGYFNRSLWDTLSGEYFRSFADKTDYFHIFDYWHWDEKRCNETLKQYEWELAPDTNTTWRIGDGTAAFYNYLYYTVVGFTEHDTFRSNQIREGQLNRDEALNLVLDENRPRYKNIRWYLDSIGMNYTDTISQINSIQAVY